MSVIKLRTLTEKSKLGFGKYADYTVADLLARKNRAALAWYYYNCSNITFTPEVLDKIFLGHPSAVMIEKPGKSPESLPDHWRLVNTMTDFKLKAHNKKEHKVRVRNYIKGRENEWFNKSLNAWKNQGH